MVTHAYTTVSVHTTIPTTISYCTPHNALLYRDSPRWTRKSQRTSLQRLFTQTTHGYRKSSMRHTITEAKMHINVNQESMLSPKTNAVDNLLYTNGPEGGLTELYTPPPLNFITELLAILHPSSLTMESLDFKVCRTHHNTHLIQWEPSYHISTLHYMHAQRFQQHSHIKYDVLLCKDYPGWRKSTRGSHTIYVCTSNT